jgi:sensor histidine kinase regulating citrate/malate metabolism
MRLTPQKSDTFHTVAIILVVLTALFSAITAIWFGSNANEALRTQLGERSKSIAAALGSEQISQLKGEVNDAHTDVYKNLKTTLANVKSANPDARSIYIMGRNDGQLFFFVDSEQPV